MTILADFNVIINEDFQGIGVRSGSMSMLGGRFNTGGRIDQGSQTGPLGAFLMFSVLNLDLPLGVFVNANDPQGGLIGTMEPNFNGQNGWATQVLCMAGSRLDPGDGLNNEIAVALPEGHLGTTAFQIKNLICFYHQDSD